MPPLLQRCPDRALPNSPAPVRTIPDDCDAGCPGWRGWRERSPRRRYSRQTRCVGIVRFHRSERSKAEVRLRGSPRQAGIRARGSPSRSAARLLAGASLRRRCRGKRRRCQRRRQDRRCSGYSAKLPTDHNCQPLPFNRSIVTLPMASCVGVAALLGRGARSLLPGREPESRHDFSL